MRNKSIIIILSLLGLFVSSCKHDSSKAVDETDPQMELSSNDTAKVLELTKQYLEYLKADKIDSAMEMLFFYADNNTLTELPDTLAMRQRAALNMFRVYDYRIDMVQFYKEDDSKVSFYLQISEPDSTNSSPAEIGASLRPIRYDGHWFLTIADRRSETHESQLDKLMQ